MVTRKRKAPIRRPKPSAGRYKAKKYSLPSVRAHVTDALKHAPTKTLRDALAALIKKGEHHSDDLALDADSADTKKRAIQLDREAARWDEIIGHLYQASDLAAKLELD